nr:probable RNA-dependent RNA polymerase 5 [Ipomoea trifida]
MSTAADSWLALMDRLLVLGNNCESEMEAIMVKMLELIDLYYDALDAPKSGKKVNIPKDLKVYKFPHFMGKQRDAYHSTSVLGEIYDTVVSFETKAPPPVEITTLPCFDIKVPDECLRSWRKRYNEYRAEMTEALSSKGESQNDLANEVIKKYKQLLYGADELEESEKSMKDIYDNALAIYHVTYDHAMLFKDAKKCGFAWKVAGSALCKLHAELQAKENNGKAMIVSPVMLQKILHLKV